jgi:hypothetical protein
MARASILRCPGAITVLYEQPPLDKSGDSPTGFHVGFFVSNEHGFTLLGGNQDNTAKVKAYNGSSRERCSTFAARVAPVVRPSGTRVTAQLRPDVTPGSRCAPRRRRRTASAASETLHHHDVRAGALETTLQPPPPPKLSCTSDAVAQSS